MLQLFVPKRNKYNNSIKLNINILFCLVLLHFEKKRHNLCEDDTSLYKQLSAQKNIKLNWKNGNVMNEVHVMPFTNKT